MVILLRPSHVLNEMQDFIRCIRILLSEAHLMAADSYKPEGFKSAVLGREQIRPKVKSCSLLQCSLGCRATVRTSLWTNVDS